MTRSIGIPLQLFIMTGRCILDPEDAAKYRNLGAAFDLNGYIVVWVPELKRRVKLHTLILQTDLDVDHIHGIRYDCRKSELRVATRSQNLQNSKISSRNTSGIKGVDFMPNKNKWRARISISLNRPTHIGLFNTLEEATTAYNTWAKLYHKEFARLN